MSSIQTQTEIMRLANKLKWSAVEKYQKHISADASFEENLLTLLRVAADEQERIWMKRRLKAAAFPILKTLDTFDFNNARLPNPDKPEPKRLTNDPSAV